MALLDEVRLTCAEVAARARSVAIDLERLEALELASEALPEPQLDPERHYLEGTREDVAAFLLCLDSINFGSGWFPTLHKRPGCSGYFTVASALTEHWRSQGPWSPEELRALGGADVARVLGQEDRHELMVLYGRALNDLGAFLGERSALEAIEGAAGSAERLATQLAGGMPFFDDPGFFKRAQIVPNDLALAGVAEFSDLDGLTIFADNLVPHVLRLDGVLRYEPSLAARIDAGKLLEPGSEEREIRACALHACELIAGQLKVAPRVVDAWLWNRGQDRHHKSVPRHRTRTVWY